MSKKVEKVDKARLPARQVVKAKTTLGEPQTMAELLAMQSTSVKSFTAGERITAKVLYIGPKSISLDIGGKSEGIVAEKAFVEARDFIKKLKVGDSVTAVVLVPETREGNVILSLRQASYDASWNVLEKAMKDKEPVVVVGRGANQSGVTAEVEGITGFIPGSQLGREAAENPQSLIGKYFKALVIEVARGANKVVLSEKAVTDAEDIKLVKKALEEIKEGEIYDGVVTTIANFGCFIKLDLKKAKAPKLEGLVHMSEISYSRGGNAMQSIKVGDSVKVKVVGNKEGRLALSIKQAGRDPWADADGKYKAETRITGKISKVSDFGIFVEIEPGVEGLVHITKIPPAIKLRAGDNVNCIVEEIDSKAKKMSLGLVLTSKPIGYK